MRKRQHSKSGLFLIELMITIAFFSVTTAVFLQVFVKSHAISEQADQLFHAQEVASCVAEIMGGTPSDESDDFVQKLHTCYPALKKASDGVDIYFDKDWDNCKASLAQYIVAVSWQKQDGMWKIAIIVEENQKGIETAENDSKDKPIYTLSVQLYDSQTEGGRS